MKRTFRSSSTGPAPPAPTPPLGNAGQAAAPNFIYPRSVSAPSEARAIVAAGRGAALQAAVIGLRGGILTLAKR